MIMEPTSLVVVVGGKCDPETILQIDYDVRSIGIRRRGGSTTYGTQWCYGGGEAIVINHLEVSFQDR